jgi:hypothetical protein
VQRTCPKGEGAVAQNYTVEENFADCRNTVLLGLMSSLGTTPAARLATLGTIVASPAVLGALDVAVIGNILADVVTQESAVMSDATLRSIFYITGQVRKTPQAIKSASQGTFLTVPRTVALRLVLTGGNWTGPLLAEELNDVKHALCTLTQLCAFTVNANRFRPSGPTLEVDLEMVVSTNGFVQIQNTLLAPSVNTSLAVVLKTRNSLLYPPSTTMLALQLTPGDRGVIESLVRANLAHAGTLSPTGGIRLKKYSDGDNMVAVAAQLCSPLQEVLSVTSAVAIQQIPQLPASCGAWGFVYLDTPDFYPAKFSGNQTVNAPLLSIDYATTLVELAPGNGLKFQVRLLAAPETADALTCVYYNVANLSWDADGCTTGSYNTADGTVTCTCLHATTFTVLLSKDVNPMNTPVPPPTSIRMARGRRKRRWRHLSARMLRSGDLLVVSLLLGVIAQVYSR